jgi:hypothetical protein
MPFHRAVSHRAADGAGQKVVARWVDQEFLQNPILDQRRRGAARHMVKDHQSAHHSPPNTG